MILLFTFVSPKQLQMEYYIIKVISVRVSVSVFHTHICPIAASSETGAIVYNGKAMRIPLSYSS